MSETAMSDTTMLASLRDIRLPAEAAGGVWADYAVVIGLSALIAICVVFVLRVLSTRRPTARVGPKVEDVTGWSEDRLRVALLHQLREQDPQRYSELSEGLYRPDGGPSLAALKDEVAHSV